MPTGRFPGEIRRHRGRTFRSLFAFGALQYVIDLSFDAAMIVYIYAVAVAEDHSEGVRRRGEHTQVVTPFPSSYTPNNESIVVAVGETTGENDTCPMMCASIKVN